MRRKKAARPQSRGAGLEDDAGAVGELVGDADGPHPDPVAHALRNGRLLANQPTSGSLPSSDALRCSTSSVGCSNDPAVAATPCIDGAAAAGAATFCTAGAAAVAATKESFSGNGPAKQPMHDGPVGTEWTVKVDLDLDRAVARRSLAAGLCFLITRIEVMVVVVIWLHYVPSS
jgi:hypothetical protein